MPMPMNPVYYISSLYHQLLPYRAEQYLQVHYISNRTNKHAVIQNDVPFVWIQYAICLLLQYLAAWLTSQQELLIDSYWIRYSEMMQCSGGLWSVCLSYHEAPYISRAPEFLIHRNPKYTHVCPRHPYALHSSVICAFFALTVLLLKLPSPHNRGPLWMRLG